MLHTLLFSGRHRVSPCVGIRAQVKNVVKGKGPYQPLSVRRNLSKFVLTFEVQYNTFCFNFPEQHLSYHYSRELILSFPCKIQGDLSFFLFSFIIYSYPLTHEISQQSVDLQWFVPSYRGVRVDTSFYLRGIKDQNS